MAWNRPRIQNCVGFDTFLLGVISVLDVLVKIVDLLGVLLAPKTQGDAGDGRQRERRGGVDSGDDGGIRGNARFKVVLRLVVVAAGEVVEGKVELNDVVDSLGDAEVEDGVPGGRNGRVITIEAVVVECAHARSPAPAARGRERERGVGYEMSSAVYVDAGITAAEEGIADIGQFAA